MDYNEALGKALRTVRVLKGFTHKDLLGALSSQYLSDVELGKRAPSAAILARLCEGLGVHPAVPLIYANHLLNPKQGLDGQLQQIAAQLQMMALPTVAVDESDKKI